MGLATTPEYEELLARGYPHLRRLIEGHPHEANADAWAVKALSEGDPKHYFVDWPAAVARRYVRGYADSRISMTEPWRMSAAAVDGPPDPPIDEAEARGLIASYLAGDHYDRYEFHAHHALFLVEAMIGSAITADAVLAGFEDMPDLDSEFSTRNAIAYALGFVIRRLAPAERAHAEQRVAALVAKHAAKKTDYTRDFLSYLIGGREALEKSGRRLGLYCVHFCNDPALIRAVAADLVIGWDAQHVVLAGEEMLDALTPKTIKKIWKGHKERTIEQLGHLASPKAVTVLKEFGKVGAFAKLVDAALAARGGKPAAKKPAPVKAAKPTKKPAAKKPAPKKPAPKKR